LHLKLKKRFIHKMPRGKVRDVLGQPRREGYSCLDSHIVGSRDDGRGLNGGRSVGHSDGGRSKNGETLVKGDFLTSVSKVEFPGTHGSGEPLSSSISWDFAVSSGPVVDGADGTVESVRGLVEGASGCIQAGVNSNHLSVSRVHLDTSREGFVEEFDGVEGLFLGHIRTALSTGDSSPDVRTLAFGGCGKAVVFGEGFEFIHAGEGSNSSGRGNRGNRGTGHNRGSGHLSHVIRVVAVQGFPEKRAFSVIFGRATIGKIIVILFGITKLRAILREGSGELDGRGNGGGGSEANSSVHLLLF